MTQQDTNDGNDAFDPGDVSAALKEVSVDNHLIEGIIYSYAEELDDRAPEMSEEFRARLHSDDRFHLLASRAAWEAVVFSTLVNTVNDAIYAACLGDLAELGEVDLQVMRATLFQQGVAKTAESEGGSLSTGRLQTRSELFAAATAA